MRYVESEHMELKEQINSDFKKEIIAFANSDGGVIYVGVDMDGFVVGVEETERGMEKIGNMIRDAIKPDLTAYTSIAKEEEDGKDIIKVTVQVGLKRPYHLSNKGLKPSGVFLRHGVSSVPATDETIRQMIKETDGTVFEKMRSVEQDLTFSYTDKYFIDQGLTFNENNKKTLKLMNDDGYYTNAALLLSDQCNHIIRCAVYEGIQKAKFKTRQEFSGSILKQMDDAYSFLSLNNDIRSDFEGLRRIDHKDYPEEALREALLNAIIHRDYDYSGSIIINICDDRMEFISLGGLVKGLTLEDIASGISQPRNTVLAEIFYRLNLIESYGIGIRRIIDSYSTSKKKPEFKAGPASFVVTLPNCNVDTGVREKVVYDSTLSKEKNVLSLVEKKGQIVRKDVEQFLSCSSYPAGKILKSLIKQGKIERKGKGRAVRYSLPL